MNQMKIGNFIARKRKEPNLTQKQLADKLSISDKAIEFLSDVGYDPLFGARPVKRAIQRYLENPLAKEIISGVFKEDSVINVDVNNNNTALRFFSAENVV